MAHSDGPEGPGTGLRIAPFHTLTYAHVASPEALGARTSPPYDVVGEAERESLEAAHEHNVVRLILPRDRARTGDRYEEAARLLREWRSSGVLVSSSDEQLLVYEIAEGHHATRGLIAAVGLAEPEEGVILPHENTMPGPVQDRLSLTTATAANLEPIMLVYDGAGGETRRVLSARPDPDAVLVRARVGDTEHTVWAVSAEDTGQVGADLRARRAVIADGHHRYATSLAYRAARHAAGDGDGPWDSTLAWLVDGGAWGPRVDAIHRVLPQVPFSAAFAAAGDLAARAADREAALTMLSEVPPASWRYVITDGSQWAVVTVPDDDRLAAGLPRDRSEAWRHLDVTVLHHYLVGQVWGLSDGEDTVWYRHDVPDALAAAASSGGTAVLLNPTPVAQVAAVAAAGERMPRKSTLFLPKPRTGLVMRTMEAPTP